MIKLNSQKNVKKIFAALTVALVALIPLLMEKNILLKQNKYYYVLLCLIGIYSIATSGLDILFGYTGQISFGHAGFFCIGAYGSVLLSHKEWGIAALGISTLPPIVTIVVAGLLAAIIGVILALPASKLVFHFLSLLTIAFNQIMLLFVANFSQLTNGYIGITSIPAVKIFDLNFATTKSKFMYFYLVLFFLVVLLILKQNLIHSRVGRGLIAIRENQMAANGCGVDIRKYKIISFGISAFYVGIAGGLYAHMVGFISPDTFIQNTSVIFITMLLFGGSGNLFGPIIGAVVITFIQEGFQAVSNYRMLIYGIFLLLLILYKPNGIVGIGKDISRQIKRIGGAGNGNSRS